MSFQNLFDIAGKVAVVTGGGRGIGGMIAEAFATNGATVYIASRSADELEQAAQRFSKNGTCKAIPADLSTQEGIAALRDAIAAEAGKVDVLVNNAGAAVEASVDDFPEDGWDLTMDLNAKSVFFLSQAMLPLLRAAGSADNPSRIINIVSTAGVKPPPFEAYAYSASKAACVMITRHMAKRLATEHVLVNAIAPGPFATDMMEDRLAEHGERIRAANPLKRLGTPEDMAGCALFLASRASQWTTGAVIPCDGGSISIG